jgi:hypothetical protein
MSRIMFRFWLDDTKSDENELIGQVDNLKQDRSFTSTIRDGIRLVCDLRDGKLDVLFELFPWVRAEFLQYMREVAIETSAGQPDKATLPNHQIESERAWLDAEQERLEHERAWQEHRLEEARQALEAEKRQIQAERAENQSAIQKQLARLEELLLSQGHQLIGRPIQAENHHPNRVNPVQSNSGGLKQLSVPQFTAPPMQDDEDEDDLLELKKDESAAMRTTQNFLKSMMSLTDDNKQPPKGYSTGGKRRYNREVGQQ